MKFATWVETVKRGHWQITDAGRARLSERQLITQQELTASKKRHVEALGVDDTVESEADSVSMTPNDRIDAAVAELKEAVRIEILAQLRANSPLFFEKAVLDLLRCMGYVGGLGRVEHSGQSGDGGIDGILYLDRLGLERVHVQAKRWKGSVGSGVVRDFAGAMDVQGANKGVIVTTGDYTKSAKEYVEISPKVIRLVDGVELADLMIEFAVGVSQESTFFVPRLDLDYFED